MSLVPLYWQILRRSVPSTQSSVKITQSTNTGISGFPPIPFYRFPHKIAFLHKAVHIDQDQIGLNMPDLHDITCGFIIRIVCKQANCAPSHISFISLITYPDQPPVRPKSRKSWWKGNGFHWVPPFTLPFRPLLPWKGNGFHWVPPFTLPFRPLLPSKGNEFRWVPPFTLPFRPLLPWKGNGFRWVSLFTLPFRPLLPSKGNEFRWVPPFTLPFRPLLPSKGNGFWQFSLFSLPLELLASFKGNEFR